MKRLLLMTVMAVSLSPLAVRAASLTDPGVPHTINLQSIVYDASGNVTKSDKVDVSIRILDADNNVVFSEDHNDVQVIEGAINLEIGSESGGVPLEALDPSTGTKLIDVLINGANPFDLMPLGAVPYAMWAEKAVSVADDAIESRHIKNGSIKAEDIDPLAFADIQGQAAEGQLPSSVATDAELNAHINSGTAHPASAIVVSGSFITFVATNVQEGLQKLDQKLADEIYNRQNMNINSLPGTLGETKIDALIARDSEVTAAVAAHAGTDINTAHPGTITSAKIADGTIKAEDLASGAGSGFEGWDTNAADDITTSGGTISGGDLTMSGRNIVMSGAETVDGVDVSALSEEVIQGRGTNASLDERFDALEGGVQWSDLPGQIPDNKVPQYMRPSAFGTATFLCSGLGASIEGAYNSSVANFFRINFDASVATPYVVILTGGTGFADARVGPRDSSGFNVSPSFVSCGGSPPPAVVDFVVFRN